MPSRPPRRRRQTSLTSIGRTDNCSVTGSAKGRQVLSGVRSIFSVLGDLPPCWTFRQCDVTDTHANTGLCVGDGFSEHWQLHRTPPLKSLGNVGEHGEYIT